jgi:hypothetical protein
MTSPTIRTIDSNLPDITRPDVSTVLVSTWAVGTPDRQRALAESFVARSESAPWPGGLLSASLFASTDGDTLLNYSQWSGEGSYREFAGYDIPGIERDGPVQYRLYRSRAHDNGPTPGCVVIVSVVFNGPDEQRQRRWVDTVFEAMESEAEPVAGGISGHFHLSTNGTRVLNYAEWTDEEAHRLALRRSRQSTIGSGPKWRDVIAFPGVVSGGFKRYRILESLSRRTAA